MVIPVTTGKAMIVGPTAPAEPAAAPAEPEPPAKSDSKLVDWDLALAATAALEREAQSSIAPTPR